MKREQLIAQLKSQFDSLFPPLRLEHWESADGVEQLSLSLKRKRFEVLCGVEYRPTPHALKLRAEMLRSLARQRRHTGGIGVLAAHLSRPSFAACEDLGLACFDLAGACLVSLSGVYVKMQAAVGQRDQRAMALDAAFAGTRANVIRALLAEPDQVWSIAALSERAQVSGGQVSKAIKPLTVAGYVEAKRGKGGIHVLSPGPILDAWAEHYVAPGTALNYTSRDSIDQLETRLVAALNAAKLPYALSGFSGNALLTASGRYNEAEAYVVASETQLQRLAVELGLFPALETPKLVLRAVSDEAVLVGTTMVVGPKSMPVTASVMASPTESGTATTMVVGSMGRPLGRMVASREQVYLDLLKHPQRGEEAATLLRTMVMRY